MLTRKQKTDQEVAKIVALLRRRKAEELGVAVEDLPPEPPPKIAWTHAWCWKCDWIGTDPVGGLDHGACPRCGTEIEPTSETSVDPNRFRGPFPKLR